MGSGFETEVKIPISSAGDVMDRLHSAALHVIKPRIFEANTLYDTPDQSIRKQSAILRIREVGDSTIVTWKGRGEAGPHKRRAEIETKVGSRDVLHEIFGQLGFAPVFRYEKYRTEFAPSSPPSPRVVTVDETPIGDFLEIEGPGEWIDQMASQLGFTSKDYVLESYGALYLADCRRRGVQPTNMVFRS